MGIQEIIALIHAKQKKFIVGLIAVDRKDLFKIATFKWQKITKVMIASGHLLIARNGTRCKDKWGVLYGHFNRIFDYMLTIGKNTKYWVLTMQKMTTLNVIQDFNKLTYKMINFLWGASPSCVLRVMFKI